MKSKFALIPLLGAVLAMAPLAAFADTVPHITVNGGNTVYADQTLANENIDWTCTGLGDDGNGHYYIAMPYTDSGHPSWSAQISDCGTTARDAFLNQFSDLNLDATYHWVIWDDNDTELNYLFNHDNLYVQETYSEMTTTYPGTWVAETGDVTMSSEDTP